MSDTRGNITTILRNAWEQQFVSLGGAHLSATKEDMVHGRACK